MLANVIRESKNYAPKEKENHVYVDGLVRMMEEFLGVLDLMQEREYGLDDQ